MSDEIETQKNINDVDSYIAILNEIITKAKNGYSPWFSWNRGVFFGHFWYFMRSVNC